MRCRICSTRSVLVPPAVCMIKCCRPGLGRIVHANVGPANSGVGLALQLSAAHLHPRSTVADSSEGPWCIWSSLPMQQSAKMAVCQVDTCTMVAGLKSPAPHAKHACGPARGETQSSITTRGNAPGGNWQISSAAAVCQKCANQSPNGGRDLRHSLLLDVTQQTAACAEASDREAPNPQVRVYRLVMQTRNSLAAH